MTRRILPLEIFTDGSCLNNTSVTNFGAWAFIIHRDNEILFKDSGSEPNTTNQRMELAAAAEALERTDLLKLQYEEIVLYSDSAYLVNCWVQSWWIKWLENNWRNSKRQPVANQDLWWRIIPYFERQHYSFQHVKGHADSVYNNMVDKMAQAASRELEAKDVQRAQRRGIKVSPVE